MNRLRICVVDTTFARINLGDIAVRQLRVLAPSANIHRWTVPGIKDIPGAVKRMIDRYECDGVIALGWVGKEYVDKLSYVAYSTGLMLVAILTGKLIIDVTIHEDESDDPLTLKKIAEDRVVKHTRNLVVLLRDPEGLISSAGKGKRQGYPDVGSIA